MAVRGGARRAPGERPSGKRATLAAALSEWASSLRFSGFTMLIVGLVVIGALIISPILSTYVQQQRQLSELRESVKLHRELVADAEAERLKWQDPVYVRSQARGRLFYVLPGEKQLSVIQDVVIPEDSQEETSDELTQIEQNWAEALLASTLSAGTTTASAEDLPQVLLGIPSGGSGPVSDSDEDE